MHDRFRILSALLMALSLAFSGIGLAQARALDPAVGQMVLCAETGPIAIFIDANGRPNASPRHCAECTLALSAVLLTVSPLLDRRHQKTSLFHLDSGQLYTRRAGASAQARGPPRA